MTQNQRTLIVVLMCLAPALVFSHAQAPTQGLNPAEILKPLGDSWRTYSPDYSGKRYSTLTQINQSNVKNLTLAWSTRLNGGPGGAPGGAPRGGAGFRGSRGGGLAVRRGVLVASALRNSRAQTSRDRF